MAGEGGDEVGVPDQLVDVSDEGAAGHMAAGYLVDGDFLLGAGDRVELRDQIGDAGEPEDGLDILIVFLGAPERKQPVPRPVPVSGDNLPGDPVQRHDNRTGRLPDGFGRDVFHGPVDDITLLQAQQVADAAAHIALEDENVPLDGKGRMRGHVRRINLLHIIKGQVNRRPIPLGRHLKALKG